MTKNGGQRWTCIAHKEKMSDGNNDGRRLGVKVVMMVRFLTVDPLEIEWEEVEEEVVGAIDGACMEAMVGV